MSAYWVLNKLTFLNREDFEKHKALFINGNFDFNQIVPEPKEELDFIGEDYIEEALYYFLSNRLSSQLSVAEIERNFNTEPFHIAHNDSGYYAVKVKGLLKHFSNYKDEQAAISDLYNRGQCIASLVDSYQCQDRKQWRKKYWGTTEQAFNISMLDNGILFNTKFSPPSKVIKKLAKDIGLNGEVSIDSTFVKLKIKFESGEVASEQVHPFF